MQLYSIYKQKHHSRCLILAFGFNKTINWQKYEYLLANNIHYPRLKSGSLHLDSERLTESWITQIEAICTQPSQEQGQSHSHFIRIASPNRGGNMILLVLSSQHGQKLSCSASYIARQSEGCLTYTFRHGMLLLNPTSSPLNLNLVPFASKQLMFGAGRHSTKTMKWMVYKYEI